MKFCHGLYVIIIFVSTLSDLIPSDEGLCGLLNILPLWEEYAISLGLTLDHVTYFHQEIPQQNHRGMLALNHWRNGHCGPSYPNTWRFLLKVINDTQGYNVADDLEKKLAANENWTQLEPSMVSSSRLWF